VIDGYPNTVTSLRREGERDCTSALVSRFVVVVGSTN